MPVIMYMSFSFVPFNLVKPCFNLILLKKFFTSSPMLTYAHLLSGIASWNVW